MVRRLASSPAASTTRAGVVSCAVCTAGRLVNARRAARGGRYCPRGEHAVAGRRLQPGRRLPGQAGLAARGARRLHRGYRGVAPERVQPHRLRTGPRGGAGADVSLPFGGVPFGVKELEKVAGWPYTEASVIFKDRVSDHDDTSVLRLRTTGAVLAAQTTAPEFGGINCTSTELHGTTRNPWNHERTPGGSSGGTAAAVPGGLLPIATGSDGGGSIRGPAGFSGLFGLKATYGRIPKGPAADRTDDDRARVSHPLGARHGAVLRRLQRLRPARPAQPAPGGRLGGRTRLPRPVRPDRGHRGRSRDRPGARRGGRGGGGGGERLAAAGRPPSGHRARRRCRRYAGMGHGEPARDRRRPRRRVPRPHRRAVARDRRRHRGARERYDLERAASIERYRRQLNDAMADLFDEADFVFCSTHPDVRSRPRARHRRRSRAGPDPRDRLRPGHHEQRGTHGAVEPQREPRHDHPGRAGRRAAGRPAGAGRPSPEQLLLDLALQAERTMPWPLVAPGSPSPPPARVAALSPARRATASCRARGSGPGRPRVLPRSNRGAPGVGYP